MNTRTRDSQYASNGWRKHWHALAEREQRALLLAALVVGLTLLWLLALQPALRTLRDAPAQLDRLDNQIQAMRGLAAEAAELRSTPALTTAQAEQALRAASERLGPQARLNQQADRAVVTLQGVGANALNDWLSEVRSGARARPVDAQLVRGAEGFSGTITLELGAAR